MSKTTAKSSKKTAAKKVVSPKVPAKKAAIKKATTTKVAAKKAVAKKVAVKKTAVKATEKQVAKKSTPATPVVKKPAAKKTPIKTSKPVKPAIKKILTTTPIKLNAKVAPAQPSKVGTVKIAQVPSKSAEAKAPLASPVKTKITMLETLPTSAKVDPKLANAWKKKSGRELTEEELLAMPDSTYMNDHQQDFFRAQLEALKDDLLSNAGETTEHLREDTSIVPDPADRATIEEEHALELRTRDRERKLLKKISQALTRIDAGDYGYCDETGEPIGLRRLLARPTATLSLEAQQRRELKQRMFGD